MHKTRKDEYLERWAKAETRDSKMYWFRRAMEASGIDRATKWVKAVGRRIKPEKNDRRKANALLRLQTLYGEMPKTDEDRLQMAYKAYHKNQITKRQARVLGCNFK